ncbi:MAG: penicillin-binding protein [Ruminococcaceae bacterium]|nr:penicillin-binding protein [Oscillospiraceae bacterium]
MGSHKKRTAGSAVKDTFANIGRVLAALIMVGIITGCIVAAVLTVYVLRYINSDEQINLTDLKLNYTTILYADDPATGEPYELKRLHYEQNRIWVPYDQIPEHMVDALIAIEDKRFWQHHGVDWKRTTGAFVNLFVPIYPTQAGGSTITQQLIKNITGDDAFRIERKVQEIFRALNLEKHYSKEQILEAYLNTVYYSNSCYGVQAAANTYFGKDVSELTLAESASIIGITQFPGKYDPFAYPEYNKERQEDILYQMLDQGMITQEEYDDAVEEKLVFQKDVAYQAINSTQNYFIDHVIEEVLADLQSEKGFTRQYATQQLYSGGYRIYTTMDEKMQNYVEEFYSDVANFPRVSNETYPQSACVITDLNGRVLALAGGIGEKEYDRSFNRATQALRQCGSSIKPIAAYLQGIENDVITYSTVIEDSPITLPDGTKWPSNYYGSYLGPSTVDTAIQKSINTIPVKIIEMVTPRRAFDFLKDKLGFDSLVEREVVNGQVVGDVNLSSMALGGMTHGVTVMEMAGAYQIYGNGGYFTKPYAYTKVLDANGDVVLEKDTTPRRVISAETATIVNKLMQRVTRGPMGTGAAAPFSAMPVAGKTGTSSEDIDQWFLGVTPYYVGAFWMGYDNDDGVPQTIRYTGLPYPPPLLYKSVMGHLHEGLEVKQFPVWGDVVEKTYCAESGELAVDGCTKTLTGWYKSTNIPPECSLHSGIVDSKDLDDIDDLDDLDSDGIIYRDKNGKVIRRSRSGLIIANDD